MNMKAHMSSDRASELQFLLRTKTPVLITDVRDQHSQDDWYTVTELLDQQLLSYLGSCPQGVFVRSTVDFSVMWWQCDQPQRLLAGSILVLDLSKQGQQLLECWLQAQGEH